MPQQGKPSSSSAGQRVALRQRGKYEAPASTPTLPQARTITQRIPRIPRRALTCELKSLRMKKEDGTACRSDTGKASSFQDDICFCIQQKSTTLSQTFGKEATGDKYQFLWSEAPPKAESVKCDGDLTATSQLRRQYCRKRGALYSSSTVGTCRNATHDVLKRESSVRDI